MPRSARVLVGIAGGSASGKTLIARRLVEDRGEGGHALLELDAYYRPLGHLPPEERRRVNFDHPDAFDFELLTAHARQLLAGRAIEAPLYDYKRDDRRPETRRVEPGPVIIVEGILAFWWAPLRELMDVKIFVDAPADLRLLRRIRRDILDRGRELKEVLAQYEHDVRPMHEGFVEPDKRHADIIVPRGGENLIAIDVLRSRLAECVRDAAAPSRTREAGA